VRYSLSDRVIEVCNYIIDNRATIRQAAKEFGVSKSTVHKDCQERAPLIDAALAQRVQKVLDFNLAVRHIRGGISTKRKFCGGKNKKSPPC